MIQIQGKIPRDVTVACSGGVDSIAAAHFLSNNHNVELLFIDHGTPDSESGLQIVKNFASQYLDGRWERNLHIYTINSTVPRGLSKEEHWRNERYKVFHQMFSPVITCHHLDDCVETWVWSSLHGEGKIIPYSNRNVIRPFRLTRKSEFYDYAICKGLTWAEDSSNMDTKYMRNYIRHVMMPQVLHVNPGIRKVVAKKVKKDGFLPG